MIVSVTEDDSESKEAYGKTLVGRANENGGHSANRRGRGRSKRYSRARTGCFTCRARRKKCDETRDETSGACMRCVKSGVECLGFPQVKGAPLAAHFKKRKAEGFQENDFDEDKFSESIALPVKENKSLPVQVQSSISTRQSCQFSLSEGEELQLNDLLNYDTSDGESGRLSAYRADSEIRSTLSSPILHTHLKDQRLSTGSPSTESLLLWGDRDKYISQRVDDSHSSLLCAPSILDFNNGRNEDLAIKTLASFYGTFCWHWWQPCRRRRNLQQVVQAIERRLRRSEIVCTTVAAVAACYGFGNHITLHNLNALSSFRQSWEGIYEIVRDNKTSSLCAYIDWLSPQSSAYHNNSQREPQGDALASNLFSNANIGCMIEMWDTTTSFSNKDNIEVQADRLFSFASKVLAKVSLAAKHDQSCSADRSYPLDYGALVHVDIYLQAAMDLALFAYACRPASVFHREFNAAGALLESLLGHGQSVRLSEIDGIETAGFRTFVWADITNAMISCRCTRLHYLLEEIESPNVELEQAEQAHAQHKHKQSSSKNREKKNSSPGRPTKRHDRQQGNVNVSFGCPDDILVILAAAANLHFQLRNARQTGAITGQGPDSLPAWALHNASDLLRRIEQSERVAEQQKEEKMASSSTSKEVMTTGGEDKHHGCGETSRQGHDEPYILTAMWRHAAVIFIQTTAFCVGPLGAVNQARLHSLINLWQALPPNSSAISNGNPALPMLFASFVATKPQEREVCREALQLIGHQEMSRKGYRTFVEKLWGFTDHVGFGILWYDLLDDYFSSQNLAIL